MSKRHSDPLIRIAYENLIFDGPQSTEQLLTSLDSDSFLQLLQHPTIVAFDAKMEPIPKHSSTPNPHVHGNIKFLCVQEESRLEYILKGRVVVLSEPTRQALFLIAKSRSTGVTQADLAKALNTDPRNLFHMLTVLRRFNVITRIPVSVKKTFTYLLLLTQFFESSDVIVGEHPPITKDPIPSNPTATFSIATEELRIKIMQFLAAAPSQSMSSKQIFQLLSLPSQSIKLFRKVVLNLALGGYLDIIVANDLGASSRLLRYRSPYQPKSTKAVSQSIYLPYPNAIALQKPLDFQVLEMTKRAGKSGATLSDYQKGLGISSKLAYRLVSRCTGEKSVLKLPSGGHLSKISEFYGKERRIRLFYTDEHDNGLCSNNVTEADEPKSGIQSETVPYLRDSVNRLKRQQAIVQLLSELIITDVGKQLALKVQKLTDPEGKFSLDVKTLRRTITALEANGQAKTLIVVLPNGVTRTLLLRPDVSPTDPRIEEYLTHIQQGTSICKVTSVPLDDVKSEQFATSTITNASDSKDRSHKFVLERNGYVSGIMLRAKLLHEYLLESVKDDANGIFETIDVIFKRIPLYLFLKIVGLAEISTSLHHAIQNITFQSLPLCELPVSVQAEILKRRGYRFRHVVRALLEILTTLKLIEPDNSFPSLGFRIPFQYRFLRIVSIRDEISKFEQMDDGTPFRKTCFQLPVEFEEFWRVLEEIATSTNNSNLPLHTIKEKLPNKTSTFELLFDSASWKQTRPINRGLIRKLCNVIHTTEPENRSLEVDRLASAYGIEKAKLEQMAEGIALKDSASLEAKRAARKAALKRKREMFLLRVPKKKPKLETIIPDSCLEPSQSIDDSRIVEETKLSEEFVFQMRLMFILLNDKDLLSTRGTLRWHLAEELLSKEHPTFKLAKVIRTHFIRWCLSDLNALEAMERLEQKIEWIRVVFGDVTDLGSKDSNDEVDEDYHARLLTARYMYFRQHLGKPFDMLWKESLTKTVDPQQKDKPMWSIRHLAINEFKKLRIGRHYQFQLLARKSYVVDYISSISDPVSNQLSLSAAVSLMNQNILAVIADVKMVMAMPSEKYDSIAATIFLSRHSNESIKQATLAMVQLGLLSKSSGGKGRYRIPGTSYSLVDKLGVLVDQHIGFTHHDQKSNHLASNSIDELAQSIFSSSPFQIVPDHLSNLTNVLAELNSPNTQPTRFSRIQAIVNNASTNEEVPINPIWLLVPTPSSPTACIVNRPVLHKVLELLDETIRASPGISQTILYSSQWPILFPHEIHLALQMLINAKLIAVISLNNETFLRSL